MTQLRFEEITIEAAGLGEENCLPDILNNKYIHTPIRLTERIPKEDGKLIGKGMIKTLLPYRIQDGYDRNRKPTGFHAAVLENEYLKATFMPSLGGRLWSLIDKRSGRELLYCNSVFQPANLALRNAWFSGGVEWNVGIKGHNPLTCSQLFACQCMNSRGEPVLKMYDYERIRGVVFTIYATLKDDVLLVHPVIENTENKDKHMYWWSNIAVDEEKGMRILAPAEDTFVTYYDENGYVLDFEKLPIVQIKGMEKAVDVTYPDNLLRAGDLFYRIPKNRKKWVAAVNVEGNGLVQFSDDLLQGRKLFFWGQQQGGRHWNEWLSDGYKPYVEIQAGLLKTQLEHFMMSANTTIQWTEGYGAVNGDAVKFHDSNYSAATTHLESMIEHKFSYLKENCFDIVSQNEPEHMGTGWGAVENRVRAEKISKINVFPETSIGNEQADWMCLLQTGSLPDHDVLKPIAGYVVGEFWENYLREHLQEKWYDHYLLGVICSADGRYDEAMACFIHSNELEQNPWAIRCIAQIQKNVYADIAAAAENMCKAVAMKGDYQPLLYECADALIAAGQYDKWLDIYNGLMPAMKENGRLVFYNIGCMIKKGKLDSAAALLTPSLVVCDIKEGEYSISELWIELYRLIMARDTGAEPLEITNEDVLEKYPLPYELDYRMH